MLTDTDNTVVDDKDKNRSNHSYVFHLRFSVIVAAIGCSTENSFMRVIIFLHVI
jgi:hypothetical protein